MCSSQLQLLAVGRQQQGQLLGLAAASSIARLLATVQDEPEQKKINGEERKEMNGGKTEQFKEKKKIRERGNDNIDGFGGNLEE